MAKKIKVNRFSSQEPDTIKKGKTALVVLIIVVVLLTGFAIGRSFAPKGNSVINTQKTSNVGETQTGYGPFNQKTIIPSKYDHSTEGAVAASSTYISNSPRLFLLKEDSFDSAILSISSSTYGPVIRDAVLATRANAQKIITDDPNTFYREIPMGYQVITESKDRVQVKVWSVNMLVAKPDFNGNTKSNIHTMDLVWEDNDWKIDNWVNEPGPTPRWQSENDPLSVEDFITAVSPFTGGYDYAPSF